MDDPWAGSPSDQELGLVRHASSRAVSGRRNQVLARDGHACVVPGCRGQPLTIDHILPVSRGGTKVLMNLQTLCVEHNQLKGDLSQAAFQRALGVTWRVGEHHAHEG